MSTAHQRRPEPHRPVLRRAVDHPTVVVEDRGEMGAVADHGVGFPSRALAGLGSVEVPTSRHRRAPRRSRRRERARSARYVERVDTATSGRALPMQITPHGRTTLTSAAAAAAAAAEIDTVQEQFFQCLPVEQRTQLIATLQTSLQGPDQHSVGPPSCDGACHRRRHRRPRQTRRARRPGVRRARREVGATLASTRRSNLNKHAISPGHRAGSPGISGNPSLAGARDDARQRPLEALVRPAGRTPEERPSVPFQAGGSTA